MAHQEKTIRIVIPAHKAAPTITQCLDGLLHSLASVKGWEIIVVDNGQNHNLTQLLQPYPVTVLERKEKASAAYARNEGAKGFARGILVFLDSDVICEPDCLPELIQPLLTEECCCTIGNYSKNLTGLTFAQKYKQLYISHIYDRDGSKIKNDFWTAISAVDAQVFQQLNGFNTSFLGANGEDQEFGIRLTRQGHQVQAVKQATGQHLNPYSLSGIVRNDFRKGVTALKNTLKNRVPISDNRHSKKTDILAVFFAVQTLVFCLLGLVYPFLFILPLACASTWLVCRGKLSLAFLTHGGLLFWAGTLLLMFTLDLVRFACVVIGLKNAILPLPIKEESGSGSLILKA